MTLATTLPVTPTRRHQLPICVVLATASLLCGAADYKTPEFTDKKSRVSNVYICAVVGRKQGYEPNANKILAKFEIISKVSPERSSAWREDAELWWEKEHTNYDLKAFWAGLCAEPFDRIGKATSPASPQPVQVAEVATQEQIRSASCAITAMPKEVTERLILASQTYMKTRDSIALVAAFQLDEVPTYLSKCFEVHAQISIKGTISSRDFAHFYDGSERAMRLLLFIELAKRRGQAVETIKKLNDQMYEGILRFNREHY